MDCINNQDCIRTPLTLSMQVTWCWQMGNQLLIQSQTFDPKSVPSAIEQPLNSAVKCKFKSVSIQLSAAFTGSLNQNLDPTRYYNNLSLTSITIVVCSYCPLVTTLVVLIVELHCSQLRPPCHSSFVKFLFSLVFRNLSPDVIYFSSVDAEEHFQQTKQMLKGIRKQRNAKVLGQSRADEVRCPS